MQIISNGEANFSISIRNKAPRILVYLSLSVLKELNFLSLTLIKV